MFERYFFFQPKFRRGNKFNLAIERFESSQGVENNIVEIFLIKPVWWFIGDDSLDIWVNSGLIACGCETPGEQYVFFNEC